MTQESERLMEDVGEFLGGKSPPVIDLVEVLSFFLADAAAQMTDRQYSPDTVESTKELFEAAYRICCDMSPTDDTTVTTH
jgi:hypothetical protein